MANRLSREKQIFAMQHLVEGCTIRSTSRMSGIHRDTIGRLLLRFGRGSQLFMDDVLKGLHVTHLQIDETHTFCQKKQARLTVDEKRTRYDAGDQYL